MMEKLIINLLCELDESANDMQLWNLQKKRLMKYKNRNLLLKNLWSHKKRCPKVLERISFMKTCPDDTSFDDCGMDRSTFHALLCSLKPFWTTLDKGRLPYNLETSLYITLWKLSNKGATYCQISDRFNVGKSTAHKMFYKTIKTIICSLRKEISWPTVSQQQIVMEGFQNSRENAFPFVVGCVDCTHVKILKPKLDSRSFFNRKEFYSIHLQAICDSSYRFLDVSVGYPGGSCDAIVWENSPIYKSMLGGQVQLAKNAILLGDSAYPISKFLLTPYTDNGHLTTEQKQFNSCLKSTRMCIEQALGILKNKFRILDRLDSMCLKNNSEVVLACTILHNFIINYQSPSEYILPHIDTLEKENSTNPFKNYMPRDEDEDGVSKRDYLKTFLNVFNQLP